MPSERPSGLTTAGLKMFAEEGMFAFHTIVHNHSFRSMDCTTTLIKKLQEKNGAILMRI
jgi:hypothetical protein